MKRRVPTGFTAVRKITLGGVTYNPGQAIPAAAVKAVRNPNALLSRGWIKATPAMYGAERRGGSRLRQTRYYSPREIKAIVS